MSAKNLKQRNDLASLGVIVLACLPLLGLLWVGCAISRNYSIPARPSLTAVQAGDLHAQIKTK